jgi:hypothetical protein
VGDVIRDPALFQKGWTGGLPETPCGFGSKLEATTAQREWLPRMVTKYAVRSIADIGAGDLNWISRVRWPLGVSYRALDLVPRHPQVEPFDLVRQVPPAADLLLCLWVLNHLPPDDCRAALANIRASGSRYLAATDRPRWHAEQPPEWPALAATATATLDLRTPAGDRLLWIPLCR